MKLQKLGVGEAAARQAMDAVSEMPCSSLIALEHVPFDTVRRLPVMHITGFPHDATGREARLAVCLLPGYKGIATRCMKGMLIAFVWWEAQDTAVAAAVRLRHMRMDPCCASALEVCTHGPWSVEADPPLIIK